MKYTDQDRQCFVTLSAAKGLARWVHRCFAALRVTESVLIVKNHNRLSTARLHSVSSEVQGST
jgi:hypothetical protein